MRYTIVRTMEKLSQRQSENGTDYTVRRGFHALPTEEVEAFIAKFQGEASNAIALFEIEATDIAAILHTLTRAARELEVKSAMRPEGC